MLQKALLLMDVFILVYTISLCIFTTKFELLVWFSCLDAERGLILDAVALMGGNEYLVQQMVDKFLDTSFR